ncbi:unnamed protein product [Heterobilharzia americana]|nr:unnamed protein product [Heterobilharzia americana]
MLIVCVVVVGWVSSSPIPPLHSPENSHVLHALPLPSTSYLLSTCTSSSLCDNTFDIDHHVRNANLIECFHRLNSQCIPIFSQLFTVSCMIWSATIRKMIGDRRRQPCLTCQSVFTSLQRQH